MPIYNDNVYMPELIFSICIHIQFNTDGNHNVSLGFGHNFVQIEKIKPVYICILFNFSFHITTKIEFICAIKWNSRKE